VTRRSAETAQYDTVSSGKTDTPNPYGYLRPSQVSYGQLLKVFFSVTHDLLMNGRTMWALRSIRIFVANAAERIAQAYIDQINQAKAQAYDCDPGHP